MSNTKNKTKSRFTPYNLRNLSKSLGSILERPNSQNSSTFNLSGFSSNITDTNSFIAMNENNEGDHQSQNYVANNLDIFNSLKIPDAIKDLPKFDGNPKLLFEFLNNVEENLLYIRNTDKNPYGQILLRAIRNKIEGQVNGILNMFGTPLIWDELREVLNFHYCDKMTETSLIRGLHNLRQLNKPLKSFYSDIIELQSALCNNLQIHEKDTNVIKTKKDLYVETNYGDQELGLHNPIHFLRPSIVV